MFLCGTASEIVPVASVDGRTIGSGEPGPATRRIMTAFAEMVRSTGTPIYPGAAEPATASAGFLV